MISIGLAPLVQAAAAVKHAIERNWLIAATGAMNFFRQLGSAVTHTGFLFTLWLKKSHPLTGTRLAVAAADGSPPMRPVEF